MSEPTVPNVKTLVTLIWVSIGAAIIITLIDMKIKNDILKAVSDFYKTIGPAPLPEHEERLNVANFPSAPASADSEERLPLPNRSVVSPVPHLDNAARVEASYDLGEDPISAKSPRTRRNSKSPRPANSGRVPPPIESVSDGEES